MKPKTLLQIATAIILPLSAKAVIVDFSDYTPPTTLGTSIVAGTGTSSAVLQNSSGNTLFTYYQGYGSTGTATVSGIVEGPGGSSNYLEMTSIRNTSPGRPWSQVSTTTTFDPTVSGQTTTWSNDFSITTKGDDGSIRMGLYAYNAMGSNGSYILSQTGGTSIGLGLSFTLSNQVLLTRTGSGGTVEYWNGTVWQASATSLATWTLDTDYTTSVSIDTTSGAMTMSLINSDTSTTLFSVGSDFSDLGGTASSGGFRYSFGNMENNSSSGWVVNLDSIAMVPEPSTTACLVLGTLIGLVRWRKRYRTSQNC